MDTALSNHFGLHYKGRHISVIAARKPNGWSWGALLDDLQDMECHGNRFPNAELALADAKHSVEDFIDSCGG